MGLYQVSSNNSPGVKFDPTPGVTSFTWDYPFPKQQILDSSKLKEFADDNFKVDENGRKSFKRIENIVGKGEIACYEQFLLFPQCFQKTCTTDM